MDLQNEFIHLLTTHYASISSCLHSPLTTTSKILTNCLPSVVTSHTQYNKFLIHVINRHIIPKSQNIINRTSVNWQALLRNCFIATSPEYLTIHSNSSSHLRAAHSSFASTPIVNLTNSDCLGKSGNEHVKSLDSAFRGEIEEYLACSPYKTPSKYFFCLLI